MPENITTGINLIIGKIKWWWW